MTSPWTHTVERNAITNRIPDTAMQCKAVSVAERRGGVAPPQRW